MLLASAASRVAAAWFVTALSWTPAIAATTTIDFETPALGGIPQIFNPYVSHGVAFTANGCLTGESVIVLGCGARGESSNQALTSTDQGQIPRFGGGRVPIVATFAADQVVTSVALRALTYDVNTVTLALFSAGGSLIGSASAIADFAGCGAFPGGATVQATATEPVAYAIVSVEDQPAPIECGGVFCGPCSYWAIDNFTFGDCVDAAPPSLSVALSPSLLWPPNHSLVAVHASVEVEDDCDEAPQVTLASITNSEPDAGTGAEDQPDDIQGAELGTSDFDFALRAERVEEGDGRTYTVCYQAQDGSGNTSQACATLDVPHDRRGLAEIAQGSVPGVKPGAPGELRTSVWPNPGRNDARLAYDLPRAGRVRLTIYDVAGHEVARLVDAWRPAGRHEAAFRGAPAAGVYVYRLEWEGERVSGKFAVIRK